jgi:2-polyprenyl-3-methyl-5-hydroxy-6-metoxy-1,4-benzoquinol methylase
MTVERTRGTEGYAEVAAALFEHEASIPFMHDHHAVVHLIPASPSDVLDIGSGTGRGAAWFAAHGHRVVAAEPVDELRLPAMVRHPSPRIEWIDDSLPQLTGLATRGSQFDVVMLTAVWMHLDEEQRRDAMPRVASLVKPKGVMIMSIRHGPAPPLRRMYDVSAEETVALAADAGLRTVLSLRAASVQKVNQDAGVTWTRLAFENT